MRFTIITICFNSEKTIERTIKSVLAQTCKDYEYIVVDGTSKDGTLDIVKKYEPDVVVRQLSEKSGERSKKNAVLKTIQVLGGILFCILVPLSQR